MITDPGCNEHAHWNRPHLRKMAASASCCWGCQSVSEWPHFSTLTSAVTYLSMGLKSNRDHLLAFAEGHYSAAVAIFIVGYCVVVGLSLPGGAIMTLGGGFLFGSVLGTLYVNLGATVGATLAFLVARYLFRDWVEQKFGSRLGPIQEGFAKNAFSYLMTLRLIPLFPFFLVNMVSGLTRIKLEPTWRQHRWASFPAVSSSLMQVVNLERSIR